MSGKADKRARRIAREVSETVERQRRAMRRIPKWRTMALLFGFKGPSKRWLTRWEVRNARASAIAEKKTAHFVRREMRAGPQATPKHVLKEQWLSRSEMRHLVDLNREVQAGKDKEQEAIRG